MSWFNDDWKHPPRPSNTDKAPVTGDNNPRNDTVASGYENYRAQGTIFPYRGQEQHGVPMDTDPWVASEAQGMPDQFTDVDSEPIDPIPVVIVNQYGRETNSWSATQMVAGSAPRELVGRNTARTKVTLKNLSASVVVYIGRSTAANVLSGYPLDPAATIELRTTDEIHGISATGVDVMVAVLQEYVVRADTD